MLTPIDTPRLTLRPLRFDDAPFLVELLNDPAFLEHIGDRGVRDCAGAEQYLRTGPLAMYERHGLGLLLVERRAGGDAAPTSIGICGLLQRDSLPAPDIGFAFLPAHRAQGYGYEAAAAVLAFGRRQLGLARVLAIASPANHASHRLLARLGFRATGRVRPAPDEGEVCLFEASLTR